MKPLLLFLHHIIFSTTMERSSNPRIPTVFDEVESLLQRVETIEKSVFPAKISFNGETIAQYITSYWFLATINVVPIILHEQGVRDMVVMIVNIIIILLTLWGGFRSTKEIRSLVSADIITREQIGQLDSKLSTKMVQGEKLFQKLQGHVDALTTAASDYEFRCNVMIVYQRAIDAGYLLNDYNYIFVLSALPNGNTFSKGRFCGREYEGTRTQIINEILVDSTKFPNATPL